jgi:hypothetical protein
VFTIVMLRFSMSYGMLVNFSDVSVRDVLVFADGHGCDRRRSLRNASGLWPSAFAW